MDTKAINIGFEQLDLPKKEQERRIFQKLEFGKIVVPNKFFEEQVIYEGKKEESDSRTLKVFQLDKNTRLTTLNSHLLRVNPESPLYNYIDNGRRILTKYSNWYIFNDLNVSTKDVLTFEEYSDKSRLNLKEIAKLEIGTGYHANCITVNLVFKEDMLGTKKRLEEIEVEQQEEEKVELKDEKEKERLQACIENYKTLSAIEDTNILIKDNYLIDKKDGLKIEFKKRIVDMFDKEVIFHDYIRSYYRYRNDTDYITLNYEKIIQEIVHIYTLSKYSEPIEKKVAEGNNDLLTFKIYQYNKDTKKSILLLSMKIKNKRRKGKYKFFINNTRIPKVKMKVALQQLKELGYNESAEHKIARIKNYATVLAQVKQYSGTQLELLMNGITVVFKYKDYKIPMPIIVSNPNFEKKWTIKIGDLCLKREYSQIRKAMTDCAYESVSIQIANYATSLDCAELEDKLLNILHTGIAKIQKAEERAKGLFMELLSKNKGRIIPKDNFFIVKGKLKNYKVAVKNGTDVGVWTYPNDDYICINEKTKKGQFLNVWDKLLQFCLVMLNDGNLREEIHTIN